MNVASIPSGRPTTVAKREKGYHTAAQFQSMQKRTMHSSSERKIRVNT